MASSRPSDSGQARQHLARANPNLTRLIILLVLALPLPPAEPRRVDSPREVSPSEGAGGRPSSCSRETHFECQLDGRCIPNDFSLQCAHGQDECSFDCDLCNWQNQFDKLGDDEDEAGDKRLVDSDGRSAERTTNQSRGLRRCSWRRYLHRARPESRPLKAGEHSERNPMLKRLEQLGEQLLIAKQTKVGASGSEFLFVPILVEPEPIGKPAAVARLRRSDKVRLGASSSPLGAPLISQTNSMCQLRFKYSLWVSQQPLGAQIRAGRRLELKLVARDKLGKRRVLWTASAGPDQTTSVEDDSPPGARHSSPESPSSWLIGVVELGHLQEIELFFQAEFISEYELEETTTTTTTTTMATTRVTTKEADDKDASLKRPTSLGADGTDVGSSNDLSSGASAQVRREARQQETLVAGMAAISWLSFRHCGWPRGAREALEPREPSKSAPKQQVQSADHRRFVWPPETSPLPAPRPAGSDLSGCPKGKFLCLSRQLCIEGAKVCNFVDDCMSQAEPELAQISRLQFPPSEDESPSGVCKNVPGMDDFEQVGRRARFWSVAGNWPADKIKLQSAAINNNASSNRTPPRSAHLPRKDHTPSMRGRGHYLALEIPRQPLSSVPAPAPAPASDSAGGPRPASSNQRARTHWIYLESPWLTSKKVAGHEESHCRVKFFYNLVSNAKKTLQLGQTLPFDLYLMVEHVVMPTDSSSVAQQRLDSLTYLRPTDPKYHRQQWDLDGGPNLQTSSRQQAMIEWPGVDFWRELNHPLVGLEEGDIFYIRITLMVQEHDLRRVRASGSLSSFSFDDLSTHLGCSHLDLDEASQRRADIYRLNTRMAPRLSRFIPVNDPDDDITIVYSDYLEAGDGKGEDEDEDEDETDTKDELDAPRLRLRHKNLYEHLRRQFEPHRLIIYVLAVLVLIFGLIFLIVFVVVPHVERAVINFHDQLLLSMNDDMDSTPRNSTTGMSRDHPHSSASLSGEACELTTNGSDWDHLAAPACRWRYPLPTGGSADADATSNHYDESYLTNDSVLTILDSDSCSQQLSSLAESYVISEERNNDHSFSDTTARSNSDSQSSHDRANCDKSVNNH